MFYSCIKRHFTKLSLRRYKRRGNFTQFSLDGSERWAEVVDVYDGDTIKVIMRFRGKIDRWTIRMTGYDSPEMRPPKNDPNRGQIITKAKEAKEALINKIDNNPVLIKCGPFDKYGRLLGDVFVNGDHINAWMVANGFGYPYDGGKKLNSDEIISVNQSDK